VPEFVGITHDMVSGTLNAAHISVVPMNTVMQLGLMILSSSRFEGVESPPGGDSCQPGVPLPNELGRRAGGLSRRSASSR
jgi:hypothetical protein